MNDKYGYKTINGMMRLNQIRSMRNSGFRISEIANFIGTSKHNIRATLKSLKRRETIID